MKRLIAVLAALPLLAGCQTLKDTTGKVTGRIDWNPLQPSKYTYRGDDYTHSVQAAFGSDGQIVGGDGWIESNNGTVPQIQTYTQATAANRTEFGWRVVPPVLVPAVVIPAPAKVVAVEK